MSKIQWILALTGLTVALAFATASAGQSESCRAGACEAPSAPVQAELSIQLDPGPLQLDESSDRSCKDTGSKCKFAKECCSKICKANYTCK